MPWRFRILLALNFGWCCLALVTKSLPAWRMFESVDPLSVSLRDSKGNPLEVSSYLPEGTIITHRESLLPLLRFICEHHRDQAPFVFTEAYAHSRAEISTPDCEIHLAHSI